MVHEGDNKPYPTVMTEFSHVGLIPLFGLESEAAHLRKSVKKCNDGLEQEVSRITYDNSRGQHQRPEKMFSAKPRHKNCQVCRQEFDDYH